MAELSFQDAERIIKESPKQADELAFEYQKFLNSHPETSSAELPQSILDGKAISEAYYYLREQHEESQIKNEGGIELSEIPEDLAVPVLLASAFLQRPKIMEDDGAYQKIEEKLKEEWLKNNPGKDFSSEEGLDYLYGSLNDKINTSLHRDAESAFRSNPKFKRRLERYDREKTKIYKNSKNDPAVIRYKEMREEHLQARQKHLEQSGEEMSKEDLGSLVYKHDLAEFTERYLEKTKSYNEQLAKMEKEKDNESNTSSSDIQSAFEEMSKSEPPTTHSPQESFSERPSALGQKMGGNLSGVQKNISNIGRGSSKSAAQAGRVAGKLAMQVGSKVLMNPYVLAAIGAIILIFVISFLIVHYVGQDQYAAPQAIPVETNAPSSPTDLSL